jgi:membrane protein DedA with SNARE-associated domain
MPDSPVVASPLRGRGHPPGPHTLKVLAVPIVALIVLSNVGNALAPGLVNSHPLTLIALNAQNRNLALVTNQLDALSYYVVGGVRLLISDPLFFLLGYWYGDNALAWMERRTKTFGATLRQWEGWFDKAAYPLIFIMPNQWICLFAGAAGMSVPGFFAVNIAGTLARLFLIRRLGDVFQAPIDDLLGFIQDYRIPLLAVSIVLFAVVTVNELRHGGAGLDDLAETIEEDDAASADAPEAPDDEPAT